MTELILEGLKAKQQKTWASGDYGAVATLIHPMAEETVQAADLTAGAEVLDVAAGTGNAALAAARCGCRVTASDYVPGLLARARERAEAERLALTTEVADAENLPYAEGRFDAVLSVVGAMFAPDQERTAAAPVMKQALRCGRGQAVQRLGQGRRAPVADLLELHLDQS